LALRGEGITWMGQPSRQGIVLFSVRTEFWRSTGVFQELKPSRVVLGSLNPVELRTRAWELPENGCRTATKVVVWELAENPIAYRESLPTERRAVTDGSRMGTC